MKSRHTSIETRRSFERPGIRAIEIGSLTDLTAEKERAVDESKRGRRSIWC